MPDPTNRFSHGDDSPTQQRVPDDATAYTEDLTPPLEAQFATPEKPGELGKFGRYRLVKKLGQGGMGAVYLGYDTALDRKLALKVMLPSYAAKTDARERFLREARTAAMVRSDHVVTIFDVGEEKFVPFIAMEYLLGHPLDQYLKDHGQLPLAQVMRVCRETAIGLAAAHALGLVHRDIKPANLWLEAPKGRVKLLDFGLARIEDDDTQLTGSGAVVGTPAYMSPEQGRGLKVDHRTDLFSLGVVLYQLTTGQMPFHGSTTMGILTSLAIDTPIPPRQIRPEIPEALEAVITKLLAKNPAERFQSALEVAEALRDVEEAKPVAGMRPVVVPVESLVVGVQSQNVWEGIEDTQSTDVPEATAVGDSPDDATDVNAKPAPSQIPVRKNPKAEVSLFPLVIAGFILLAAIGLLLGIMSPSNTQQVAEKEDPNAEPKGKGNEKKPPPPKTQPQPNPQPQPMPPADPTADRKAADLVISLGGFVRVAGNPRTFRDVAALPAGAFSLNYVYLDAEKPRPVADAVLAAFKDCKELTGLVLASCIVTDNGLANFKGSTKLRELSLYGPKVGDVGVANFSGCESLESLTLDGTTVSDNGLAAFKDCKNLTSIRFSNMKLTMAGLSLFKDCAKLEALALDRTVGSAADLAVFAGCEAIKDLDLSGTPLGDDAIPHFKNCAGLSAVNLSGTKISDAGLEFFKNKQSLRELNLGGTAVTGTGLAHLSGCRQLGVLGLRDVKIGDDVLAHLKACGNLYSLNLQGTSITDIALNTLAEFPRLEVLQLRGTKVSTEGARKLAEKLPNCRIEWDGGVIEPKDDPDRRAALWLLANGGGFSVYVNGKPVPHFTAETLPRERFEIRSLNVNRNKAANDESLACLAGLRHLRFAQITNCAATDKTLHYIKDCKSLQTLILYASGVTDEGLKVLAGFPELRGLNITQLRLSEPAVKDLAAALPKCHITWSGGTIEPQK